MQIYIANIQRLTKYLQIILHFILQFQILAIYLLYQIESITDLVDHSKVN